MKHQTERKAYSDEELDRLLRKSMVELPKKIEESLESETDEEKAAFDAYFDENRRALLKERIDLEREKQRFEGEKKVYAKKRRIKIAVAVAAAFAIIIAVPVTSQSARKFLSDMGLHLFSGSNTIMEGDEEKGTTWRATDETEAWEKAKECFGAPRMLFEEYGDELGFEEGKYYDSKKEESIMYYLNGKYIFIKIKKIKKEEKFQNLVDGKLREEYKFEGDETSYVRLYEVEHEKSKVGFAQIVNGNIVYIVYSEVPYEEFKQFIKNMSFKNK